jgi:hypothetical protein
MRPEERWGELRKLSIFGSAVLISCVLASLSWAATTSNEWVPSAYTFFDECTGEDVVTSGDIHILSTSTVTENTISGTFHSNFKATGIGVISGLPYQQEVVANSAFQSSLVNGEAAQTFVGRIVVVAPGGRNTRWSPVFMHTTLDASGSVKSVHVVSPTITCRPGR